LQDINRRVNDEFLAAHNATPNEIARDTLAWNQARADSKLKSGLTPERERDLLSAWYTQR